MQLWHDKSDRSNPGGGLSPGRAFLVVIAVMLAAIGIIWGANRSPNNTPISSASPSDTSNGPSQSADAIVEAFAALTDARIAAYENRDVTQLSAFLSSDSPLREVVAEEIGELVQRNLELEIHQETLKVEILQQTQSEAVVKHVLRQDVRVLDGKGKDVGKRDGPSIRSIRWTLRNEDGEWRLHNSRVLSDRPE